MLMSMEALTTADNVRSETFVNVHHVQDNKLDIYLGKESFSLFCQLLK